MDQRKVFYLKKAGGTVAATIVPHVQPKKSNINGAMECDELEAFAIKFKEERAKFGYTQFDVQESLLNVYGLNFSQTTISRFEVLNLSFKNMQNLAAILGDWLTDLRNAHAEKCKIVDPGTNDGKRRIRKVVVTIDDMKNYRARLEQSFPTSSDHYPTSKTKLVAPEWTRTSDVPAKSERTTCTLQGSLSSLSKTFSRKRLRVRDSCSSSSQGSSADPANLFKKPKEEPLDDESMEASVKTEVVTQCEPGPARGFHCFLCKTKQDVHVSRCCIPTDPAKRRLFMECLETTTSQRVITLMLKTMSKTSVICEKHVPGYRYKRSYAKYLPPSGAESVLLLPPLSKQTPDDENRDTESPSSSSMGWSRVQGPYADSGEDSELDDQDPRDHLSLESTPKDHLFYCALCKEGKDNTISSCYIPKDHAKRRRFLECLRTTTCLKNIKDMMQTMTNSTVICERHVPGYKPMGAFTGVSLQRPSLRLPPAGMPNQIPVHQGASHTLPSAAEQEEQLKAPKLEPEDEFLNEFVETFPEPRRVVPVSRSHPSRFFYCYLCKSKRASSISRCLIPEEPRQRLIFLKCLESTTSIEMIEQMLDHMPKTSMICERHAPGYQELRDFPGDIRPMRPTPVLQLPLPESPVPSVSPVPEGGNTSDELLRNVLQVKGSSNSPDPATTPANLSEDLKVELTKEPLVPGARHVYGSYCFLCKKNIARESRCAIPLDLDKRRIFLDCLGTTTSKEEIRNMLKTITKTSAICEWHVPGYRKLDASSTQAAPEPLSTAFQRLESWKTPDFATDSANLLKEPKAEPKEEPKDRDATEKSEAVSFSKEYTVRGFHCFLCKRYVKNVSSCVIPEESRRRSLFLECLATTTSKEDIHFMLATMTKCSVVCEKHVPGYRELRERMQSSLAVTLERSPHMPVRSPLLQDPSNKQPTAEPLSTFFQSAHSYNSPTSVTDPANLFTEPKVEPKEEPVDEHMDSTVQWDADPTVYDEPMRRGVYCFLCKTTIYSGSRCSIPQDFLKRRLFLECLETTTSKEQIETMLETMTRTSSICEWHVPGYRRMRDRAELFLPPPPPMLQVQLPRKNLLFSVSQNSDTESPSSSMGPSQEKPDLDRDSDSELDEEDRMDGFLHDTGRNRRGVISYQPKLRKKKLILTPEQKQVLEIMFLVTDHPSPARMEELAASLELQFEEVRNWFNNHRARKRLESLEEKLELSAVGSQLVEQIQKMVPPKEEPKVVECKVPVASDDVKKKKKETWRDIKDLESTFPLSNPYKVFHDHDYAYVKFRTTIDNQRRWYVRFGTTEDMQRANERTLD